MYQRKESTINMSCSHFIPQIHHRDPRPRIPSCAMASSAMGLKLGVFRILVNHTHKNKCNTNVSMIFMRRAAFYTCLSSRSVDIVDAGDIQQDKPRLF